eukprot:139480-Prorocentrum_minimum.AAC.2
MDFDQLLVVQVEVTAFGVEFAWGRVFDNEKMHRETRIRVDDGYNDGYSRHNAGPANTPLISPRRKSDKVVKRSRKLGYSGILLLLVRIETS